MKEEWYRDYYNWLSKGDALRSRMDQVQRALYKKEAEKSSIIEGGEHFPYNQLCSGCIHSIHESNVWSVPQNAPDEETSGESMLPCLEYRRYKVYQWAPGNRPTWSKNLVSLSTAVLTFPPFNLIGMDGPYLNQQIPLYIPRYGVFY